MSTTTTGTVGGMADRANPVFAGGVVAVSLVASVYAVTAAPLRVYTYVRVMAGVLRTGTCSWGS